jgi:hypothetical protein
MSLPDVASLEWWQAFWERVDIWAMVLVLFGAVGEFIHQFAHAPGWRERLGKPAALLLIVGLAVEVPATLLAQSLGRQILEAERLAHLYFQAQIPPRTLRPDLLRKSTKTLKFAGKRLVSVTVLTSNAGEEADRFARALATLLRRARWNMRGTSPGRLAGITSVGVTVAARRSDLAQSAANAFVATLHRNGIDCLGPGSQSDALRLVSGEPVPKADVQVIVGLMTSPN